MRLCCDENIKRSITNLLAQEGYDAVRVQDELELGFEDEAIIRFCREESRVLLTNDDDFFEFEDHPGVLFLAEQRTPPRRAGDGDSAYRPTGHGDGRPGLARPERMGLIVIIASSFVTTSCEQAVRDLKPRPVTPQR